MNPKQLKAEFDTLSRERSNWNRMWQVCGEYISQIKQNFEAQPADGEFLTKEVFDATGVFAAYSASSAVLGMLWPGSAKQSIEIKPPDDVEISSELSEFYQRMTDRTVRAMDDPRANLSLALDEYMIDQMIFGTSGIGVDNGDESLLLYKPYGVKELFIDEGRNGKVNAVYICYEWTVGRVVDEYGIENVSPKVEQKFKADKTHEKVKILHVVKPRTEKKAKRGKLAMPFMSVHMEYTNAFVMREDGFNEMPIAVGRFRKTTYEKYGRSPAMNALPDIREANILREALIVGTEKALDMPIGVLDDGMLGGGVIDTSAKAINVFNASGNIGGGSPVFDIGRPPDLRVAQARLQELAQSISQHFSIDRLIDFNNATQMTFGEAQIRDQLRTASLSSLFSRQISEVLTPLVERSVNILWRMGEFGVIRGSEEEAAVIARGKEPEYIPDELFERLERGDDIYEVAYKTKAASASRAEEYIAIADVVAFTLQGAQVDPTLLKRLDMHEAAKVMGDIRGLPVGIIRQDDVVEAAIQQEQQQMQAQMALQSADVAAGAAEKAARAQQLGQPK